MNYRGEVIKPGNFVLVKKIEGFDEFFKVLLSDKSIFWRFKVMPTAFFFSWTIRTVYQSIEYGMFWTVKRRVKK